VSHWQEEYPVTTATNTGLTIDELAARVGMTVRNVRAYAGRGCTTKSTSRG
jgi:hypothetical protein